MLCEKIYYLFSHKKLHFFWTLPLLDGFIPFFLWRKLVELAIYRFKTISRIFCKHCYLKSNRERLKRSKIVPSRVCKSFENSTLYFFSSKITFIVSFWVYIIFWFFIFLILTFPQLNLWLPQYRLILLGEQMGQLPKLNNQLNLLKINDIFVSFVVNFYY
jgi:hypothetical protein